MFSFSENFTNDLEGIQGSKIVQFSPIFNSKNSLIFNLGGDKRFLKLSETSLSIIIDVPGNYILDNDAANKLFEAVEISVNHEIITNKSTALDCAVTSYMLNKVTYDDSYVASTFDINSIFDPL